MRKQKLLTLIVVGFALMFFCFTGKVMAGPGPQLGVEPGYKVMGPSIKGVLIAGWAPTGDYVPPYDLGIIDAYLIIDDKLYVAVMSENNPEGNAAVEDSGFLSATEVDITEWEFPLQIATDFSIEGATYVRVLVELQRQLTSFM